MNISLPDSMKSFIDEQVASGGYGTSSEYMRALIRKEMEREHLRTLLLEGLASPVEGTFDEAYLDGLRERAIAKARAAQSKKT